MSAEKKFKDEEEIPIDSIITFIEKINGLQNQDSKNKDKVEFFYRGESQYYENTKPSILREPKYFEKEKEITIEAFSRGLSTLSTEGTNFDKVSKFQHHTGLTRMLDITSNALTALFFACSSNSDKDGYILIFRGSQTDGVIRDGTLVNFKENIKKMGLSEGTDENNSHIKNLIKTIDEKEKEANIKYYLSDTAEALSSLSLLSLDTKIDLMLYSVIDFIGAVNSRKVLRKINRDAYNKLYGEIRRRTPAFEERIEVLDLFRPIIVVPSQNDERILRQDGAFIVTGLSYSNVYNKKIMDYYKKAQEKKENGKSNSPTLQRLTNNERKDYFKIHEEFVINSLREMRVKNSDDKPVRLKIKAGDKEKIMKELEHLGINTGKIYVNLDNISNHLRDKYKN